jgi:hypothetical protein
MKSLNASAPADEKRHQEIQRQQAAVVVSESLVLQ